LQSWSFSPGTLNWELPKLEEAAERHGIQQEFWDIFGHLHRTSPETNRAILAAVGASLEGPESAPVSPLPPVLVIGPCGTLPEACYADPDAVLILEDGRRLAASEIPAELPLGYHEVRASGAAMRLIVGPDSAVVPADLRRAGLGVTLYGVRSSRNWGCGDFRDLTDLIDWAVPAIHADFIALNPLHAIHNRTPFNASPYLPNSIYYRNFLYLDIEAVPGYAAIRGEFESPATLAEMAALRVTDTVSYERVAALKRRALDRIFAENPPGIDCRSWIQAEGELLRVHLPEAVQVFEPDQRHFGGVLDAFDIAFAVAFKGGQRVGDGGGGFDAFEQGDGVFHGELGAGADGEMRGGFRIAQQYQIGRRALGFQIGGAGVADGREAAPDGAVGDDFMPVEIVGKNAGDEIG